MSPKRSMSRKSRSKHSRSSRSVSKKAGSKKKRSLPPTLKLWRKVAEKHGFMIKGDFRRLPKAGTKAYDELKKDYEYEKKRLGL